MQRFCNPSPSPSVRDEAHADVVHKEERMPRTRIAAAVLIAATASCTFALTAEASKSNSPPCTPKVTTIGGHKASGQLWTGDGHAPPRRQALHLPQRLLRAEQVGRFRARSSIWAQPWSGSRETRARPLSPCSSTPSSRSSSAPAQSSTRTRWQEPPRWRRPHQRPRQPPLPGHVHVDASRQVPSSPAPGTATDSSGRAREITRSTRHDPADAPRVRGAPRALL